MIIDRSAIAKICNLVSIENLKYHTPVLYSTFKQQYADKNVDLKVKRLYQDYADSRKQVLKRELENSNQNTVLSFSSDVAFMTTEQVEILKKKNIIRNIKTRFNDHRTLSLFLSACLCGNLDIVQYLIENENFGSDDIDDNNMNGLHYAAYYNHFEVSEYLVSVGGFNLNGPNNFKETPLVSYTNGCRKRKEGEKEKFLKLLTSKTRVDIKIDEEDHASTSRVDIKIDEELEIEEENNHNLNAGIIQSMIENVTETQASVSAQGTATQVKHIL